MNSPTSSGSLRIAICGGGASAVLLLTALRGQTSRLIEVTVIEPREQLGLGVAYSTGCPLHVLNTRAGNMSATEDPDHFVGWLRREHARRPLNWTRNDFAPRQFYGQYLQACLKDAQGAPNIRFRWLRSTADSIVAHGDQWEVIPAKGDPIRADIVILATGNEAPRSIGERSAAQARPFILDDPWDTAAKVNIARDTRILLIGTGLTAVDMVVELLHRGHTGPIYAVSRRGLLPRCHAMMYARPDGRESSSLPTSLRGLVRHVRALVENEQQRGTSWQNFFNEMRVAAPLLWARWNTVERRRFLRHVRPFWDVHRHRLAPQVYSRIERAISRGQLTILRGRVQDIEPLALENALRVRLRQPAGERFLQVSRIINCTGPEADPHRSTNPLLQSLVSDSLARTDILGLGFAVDQDSRIIAGNGSAHRTLYALGPLTRGNRWEVTSIAEVREQVIGVARKLMREFAMAPPRETQVGPLNQKTVLAVSPR
jgi:uncharacterized NAD(P)/FAD-binding protein YdhS